MKLLLKILKELLRNIKQLDKCYIQLESLFLKDSKEQVSSRLKLLSSVNLPIILSNLNHWRNKVCHMDIMKSLLYLPLLLKEPKKDLVYKLTKVLLTQSSESSMTLIKTSATLLTWKEPRKNKELLLLMLLSREWILKSIV